MVPCVCLTVGNNTVAVDFHTFLCALIDGCCPYRPTFEWIGVIAHEQTQDGRLRNSPLQRTDSLLHTHTHCQDLHTHTHHTHRSTSLPPALEDLPASCCQSRGKDGLCWFCETHDKTPLETTGLQQHKPQLHPLRRTGNLFSILPVCITVLCTIEQQLSRKLS